MSMVVKRLGRPKRRPTRGAILLEVATRVWSPKGERSRPAPSSFTGDRPTGPFAVSADLARCTTSKCQQRALHAKWLRSLYCRRPLARNDRLAKAYPQGDNH